MSDMAVERTPRKISVSEYFLMAEAGIVRPHEPVELLDGMLVEMSAMGKPHWVMQGRIIWHLNNVLRPHAEVYGPLTLPLSKFDAPEPDIVVLAPTAVIDLKRVPAIDEVYALIEVAETSLKRDTGDKRDLCARFLIAEYLVVDLVQNTLHRFTDPVDGQYGKRELLTYGDTFALNTLPSIVLDVDAFLPPLE